MTHVRAKGWSADAPPTIFDDMSNSRVARLTEDEIARFRAMQRLAYAGAEEVAAGLEPGVTEREATRRLRETLVARGVDDWFHVPFAWFGDRSAFRGFWLPHKFFATGRRLEEGMPFILDCAPIRAGYVADIGFAGCIGENRVFEQLMTDLAAYRTFIRERVAARDTFRAIYEGVDELITRQGYDNRHRVYPGRVIAHQVGVVRKRGPKQVVAGFGLRSLRTLGQELILERLEGRSPLWADGRASDHAPTPGLWAVEPHIGFRGVGVKFEEILVVTEDDAYWLDDDLPHVRRWAAAPRSTEVSR